jgi:hypothetical protein
MQKGQNFSTKKLIFLRMKIWIKILRYTFWSCFFSLSLAFITEIKTRIYDARLNSNSSKSSDKETETIKSYES